MYTQKPVQEYLLLNGTHDRMFKAPFGLTLVSPKHIYTYTLCDYNNNKLSLLETVWLTAVKCNDMFRYMREFGFLLPAHAVQAWVFRTTEWNT